MGRVDEIASTSRYHAVEPIAFKDDRYVISIEDAERVDMNNAELEHVGYRDGWYPSMSQAIKLAEDPMGNYEFINWLLIPGNDLLKDPENQKVRQFLEKCMITSVEFE